MLDWFSALDGFTQFFWVIAGIGSLIFIFILITTFTGLDGGDDFDDVDSGLGFQFITFKNLVSFFTIFGWVGIACLNAGFSKPMSLGFAVISGLIMMTIMAAMFYYMRKLTDSGTLDYENAIDAIGEVYLTIGANRSKLGKVSVRVQGTLRELEALTYSLTELKSGTLIQVIDATKNGILIVEPIDKTIEPIKPETHELPSSTTRL